MNKTLQTKLNSLVSNVQSEASDCVETLKAMDKSLGEWESTIDGLVMKIVTCQDSAIKDEYATVSCELNKIDEKLVVLNIIQKVSPDD